MDCSSGNCSNVSFLFSVGEGVSTPKDLRMGTQLQVIHSDKLFGLTHKQAQGTSLIYLFIN